MVIFGPHIYKVRRFFHVIAGKRHHIHYMSVAFQIGKQKMRKQERSEIVDRYGLLVSVAGKSIIFGHDSGIIEKPVKFPVIKGPCKLPYGGERIQP